jgi:DNA-directed RNA polymerase specialized sigma24 family protein
VQSNEEPTDGEMDAATQRLVEFLRHRLRHRWRNHPFIDDAIQDALMALVQRAKQQERIDDPRGFCLTVANRRMIGYHRRARKAAWNEEVTSATARTPTTPVDLVPILESLRLSHATLRVLREILAGNRTNHGIARALGKDRRTVREHRAKIIEHLRRLLPPLSDLVGGGAQIPAPRFTQPRSKERSMITTVQAWTFFALAAILPLMSSSPSTTTIAGGRTGHRNSCLAA